MDLKRNLAKNFKMLRGKKSYADFAEELGVTKSTIQAIEKEETSVRLDTLQIICTQLNVPVEWLLSDHQMESADLGVLTYALRRLDWFMELPQEAQDVCIAWLAQTAELLGRLVRQSEGE